MMRTRLLHPLGGARRQRRGDAQAPVARASSRPTPHTCDPAVERVREAGGPLDEASYTCHCGYLFSAAVSATVVCPHCGSDQAW